MPTPSADATADLAPDRGRLTGINVHVGQAAPLATPAPDVYFMPGYGGAAAIADDGEWLLFEGFDGAWQVPLIVRTLPDGAKDAISPAFSGVYASAALTSPQIQEAWSTTVSLLRDLGVVSVVLRGSPLVPQASDLPGLHRIATRQTIVVEAADTESAWDGMNSSCRRSTRKAIKNGYTGAVRQATNEDLAPRGDFRRLYEQTMRHVNAEPMYLFSEDYYRQLLDGMGSNLLICEVRGPTGAVTSSDLLLRHGQRLHAHLGGSDPDGARMGSNNLVNWTEMQFAVDDGLRQFHLGAGAGNEDGVFNFKRSFGGRQLEYAVSGQIISPEAYRAQVQSRAAECDVSADTLMATSFFPAYRAGSIDA